MLLFKTIHGSHLYGLANENSDQDFYMVVTKVKSNKARYAKQSITGDIDNMTVDFGTWIEMCRSGVPQALEAMFSEMAIVDEIADFRAGFRVGTGVYERYLRTIDSFVWHQEYKKKRHALRLAINARKMGETGRFNPTLTEQQIKFISDYAHKDTDVVYATAKNISWY